MRKLLFFLLIFVLVTPVTLSDTIHLKNGSILKGKVTSFADEQFVVMLDTGSGRYMSRAMVYIGDVARIEFDSPSGMSSSTEARPDTSAPPRDTTVRDTTARDIQRDVPRDTSSPILPADPPRSTARDAQPRNTPIVERRDTTDASPPQPRETEPSQPDRPTIGPERSSAAVVPTVDSTDAERSSRKPAGPVRTVTIDVAGKRDWTSTGLIIKRGDRIRINATGSVTLDPVTGRATGPDGMGDLVDAKKLLPDQPTGALIGVIGADNDDFIFIGRSNEFTATRDGLLFLSVNEGSLSDNTGSFKAVIELQQRK